MSFVVTLLGGFLRVSSLLPLLRLLGGSPFSSLSPLSNEDSIKTSITASARVDSEKRKNERRAGLWSIVISIFKAGEMSVDGRSRPLGRGRAMTRGPPPDRRDILARPVEAEGHHNDSRTTPTSKQRLRKTQAQHLHMYSAARLAAIS